jgi:3-oxoacyl-[acyl-carrier-protein] synthase II
MESMKRRIVVTGIGCLSSIGHGVDQYWAGLLEGRNGITPITSFDPKDLTTQIAGEIKDFDPDLYMPKKDSKRMDRVIQFSVAAAKMALDDSGLIVTEENADRIGTSIGSGIGGMSTYETQHTLMLQQGPRRISPFFIPMMIPNMVSGQVNIQFNLRGPSSSTVSACATSLSCIASAVDTILTGRADVMLAGGAEAAVTQLALAGFCSMRAMSTRNDDPAHASRPFDKERDGFVMGEGAGIVIVEEREHALKRGAKIYAEIAGYGASNDAYHIANPHPEGIGVLMAIRHALSDAGLNPDDIDYINAHATSTPVGDPCEVKAIRAVFGDHSNNRKLSISSTKSMMGHTMGAAGVLESIVCILAVKNDQVPPTINYEHPDPECPIDCVPNVAREVKVRAALNNSFGFGGHNCVLAVVKHPGSN